MDSRFLFQRQRAILFETNAASGATIGHYCTIVGIDPHSRLKYPDDPGQWLVRVFLPHQQEYAEVPARDLMGMEERDDEPLPPPALELEISFLQATDGDNEQMTGQYRVGRQRWQDFVFEKREQPVATYELRSQTLENQLNFGELFYFVPRHECLDREFVRTAIAELFGG